MIAWLTTESKILLGFLVTIGKIFYSTANTINGNIINVNAISTISVWLLFSNVTRLISQYGLIVEAAYWELFPLSVIRHHE